MKESQALNSLSIRKLKVLQTSDPLSLKPFREILRAAHVYLNAIPTGRTIYRAALSQGAIFLPVPDFLKQEMCASYIGIDITAPTIRAQKDGKRNTQRLALGAILNERSYVSNHLGRCLSSSFSPFFFLSLVRLSVDRYHWVALLFCLPSRRIRASQFIELFNTETSTRDTHAEADGSL